MPSERQVHRAARSLQVSTGFRTGMRERTGLDNQRDDIGHSLRYSSILDSALGRHNAIGQKSSTCDVERDGEHAEHPHCGSNVATEYGLVGVVAAE